MQSEGRIPVILNPSARSARGRGWVGKITALSDRVEVVETRHAGHAVELAEGFAAGGVPLVVAAGGDGTINEVVNGLARGGLGHGTVLGILPTGTMNVFAVELGLPPTLFLKRCWEVVENGRVAEVDLWEANGHVFMQLAGAGIDAQVIKETSWELKKMFGPLSYVMTAANVLGQAAPLVAVTADGERRSDGTIVLIGNGQRYGGPFKVFRDASNDDGKLDVVVVRGQGLNELLELVKAGLAGYEYCEDVDYFQAGELVIESLGAGPVAFEADGDLVGETPVAIRRAAQPLKVMVPQRGRWPLSELPPIEGWGATGAP